MKQEFVTATPVPLLLKQDEADGLHIVTLSGDRTKYLYRGPDENDAGQVFATTKKSYEDRKA